MNDIHIDFTKFNFKVVDAAEYFGLTETSFFDLPHDIKEKYIAQISSLLWRIHFFTHTYTDKEREINGENFIPVRDITFGFMYDGNFVSPMNIWKYDLNEIYNVMRKR